MHRGLRVGQVLLAFLSILFVVPGGAFAEEAPLPFQDISFEAALKLARKKHKIVLVDFFTTWCVPCRMLDATTWRDPEVAALLKKKTIALRIDAEKEPDLARRYGVQVYPTVALIKPNGTVIDRLVGYQDAKMFVTNLTFSLAGKTSLVRAQEAVEKAQHDPHAFVDARYRLGDELTRAGDYQEALGEYLWCLDEGMIRVPAYTGVRASFLLGSIASLAKQYPPAWDALKTRRDEARQKLEKSPNDRQAGGDFANLNHCLGDDQATLTYFDKLPPDAPQREALGYYLFDLLLEAKRYDDALAAVPYARFKQTFGFTVSRIQSPGGTPLPASAAEAMRDFAVRSGAKQLEALAGTGKLDDARALLKEILALKPSEEAISMVRKHLERAGHPELLNGIAAGR
jgi:thiol-disulfide isomerase/thioredoxin